MTQQVNVAVKTGIAKNGKNWYMATFNTGKFASEPIFISQLEYEYLSSVTGDSQGTDKK